MHRSRIRSIRIGQHCHASHSGLTPPAPGCSEQHCRPGDNGEAREEQLPTVISCGIDGAELDLGQAQRGAES